MPQGSQGTPCDDAEGTIQVSPAEIRFGESVRVTWSVTKRPECTFPINVAGQTVGPSGNLTLQPKANTTYLLAVMVPSRQKNLARADVAVKLPSSVEIKGSTGEWRDLLIQAVGTPGTTVRMAEDVNIDLSYYDNGITIAKGVTLTSEECIAPRRAGAVATCGKVGKALTNTAGSLRAGRGGLTLGPRLYTTTRPRPLLRIRCYEDVSPRDRVRLVGFRLHGPHFNVAEGDNNLEIGIQVVACTGVEITKLEVAGWSGQGIYLVDDESNRNQKPEDIWIHDNFFHHNQHVGGNGYGVVTQDGAYALIERNVFDLNRHAISSTGQPNAGYEARYNLVLKGGGVHGTWTNPNTHQFDVHGTDSCGIGHLNCGVAGEQFWFHHNAFQYVKDNAIKIRGQPKKRIDIYSNVFAHDDLEGGDTSLNNGAINLNDGRDRIYVGNLGTNTADLDTYGRYGVCDFDGDGRDDLFLPTGVSWWYASGAKMHWVFLNPANERLDELAFGYFDGDRRCDVFKVRGSEFVISSGGTGPWRSLGTYGVPSNQLAFGNFTPEPAGAPLVTEIFRRAPNGQWYVVSPATQDWRAVAHSGFPLAKLRFGDFTGDGITDVLAVQGGRWSISESATGGWTRLNPTLATDVREVRVANVDGKGTDDVLRLDFTLRDVKWQVSWDGRSDWKPLATIPYQVQLSPAVLKLYAYVGRFDEAPGADPMLLDNTRVGRLYSSASGQVVAYNLYPY